MALNDIYRVTVHYELPTSGASWSVYYKETVALDGADLGTIILLDAFETHIAVEILAMLAQDCRQPALTCERVFGIKEAKHVINHTTQIGVRGSDALPASDNLVVKLDQATFSGKSNGRIFIPGLGEVDSDTGTVSGIFNVGPYADFIVKLATQIAELSAGTGRWDVGVISSKVLNAAPPAKDWAGAFAPVTTVTGNTIIGVMRKRRTRAYGVAG